MFSIASSSPASGRTVDANGTVDAHDGPRLDWSSARPAVGGRRCAAEAAGIRGEVQRVLARPSMDLGKPVSPRSDPHRDSRLGELPRGAAGRDGSRPRAARVRARSRGTMALACPIRREGPCDTRHSQGPGALDAGGFAVNTYPYYAFFVFWVCRASCQSSPRCPSTAAQIRDRCADGCSGPRAASHAPPRSGAPASGSMVLIGGAGRRAPLRRTRAAAARAPAAGSMGRCRCRGD